MTSISALAPRPFRARLADRRAARAAGHLPAPAEADLTCEPRTSGDPLRGQDLLAGRARFAGHAVEAPDLSPWEIAAPDAGFAAEAQGFCWLDDLAALGSAPARLRAQDWFAQWFARYGRGRGPGWRPAIAGRRAIRLIHHAGFLMTRAEATQGPLLRATLARTGAFLARRAASETAGLPRFEALTGRLYIALALPGDHEGPGPASAALAREAAAGIDSEGGIASRNPEELAAILAHLGWSMRALAEADHAIPDDLPAAIGRAATCLRILRHADGALPRFHGGDSGAEGMLDRALAASSQRPAPGYSGRAMGYVRLSGGRTSVILDAAEPPDDVAGTFAHASTGAFELTSGRRPLVVSCGPGQSFAPEWQLAARATQSHSALCIEGTSSSRLAARRGSETLREHARVTALQQAAGDGALVLMTHDGWAVTHGLCATRELHLSGDGRRLGGTDTLAPKTPAQKTRLAARLSAAAGGGIAFSIRFHLHPEAEASLEPGGAAARITLRSGEVWDFRHDGQAQLVLAPSFYLHAGSGTPQSALQIVLSGRAGGKGARIGWTLAKSRDTPLAIRDLARDDTEAL